MPKGYKKYAKMETKIYVFLYIFRKGWNARNYFFYNRKRGFGHVKSHEKPWQNRCKIYVRKRYTKVWKIMPKGSQNESQNPSKIPHILKKRHAEIDARIWCQQKKSKVRFWRPVRSQGLAPGGKEGKPPKAALRNAGLFSLKRLTPAGVGGFRAHFWRPFGTLWAHFGVLLAQIGSLLVPCRARFWLFCTLGGLVLACFGRNSFFLGRNLQKILLHWPWYQISCKFSHANYLP